MTPIDMNGIIFNTLERPLKQIDISQLKMAQPSKIFLEQEIATNRLALESLGLSDLSALSPLSFRNNIAPSRGILCLKNTQNEPVIIGQREFVNWDRFDKRIGNGNELGPRKIKTQTGKQDILKAFPFTNFVSSFPNPFVGAATGQVPTRNIQRISTALIVASEINFEDHTHIMLEKNIKHFKIIANKIVFGKNVCLSWDKTVPPVQPKRDKQAKPPKQPQITDDLNVDRSRGRGFDGANGIDGWMGFTGENGPNVEIWALEIIGNADILISGQDGASGGHGGDGQDGGDGGNGRNIQNLVIQTLFGRVPTPLVTSGAGYGGIGGSGGRGGNGGKGGNGGNGGTFTLRSSAESIKNWQKGYYIDCKGGRGGFGGAFGLGGRGGSGGFSENLDRNGYSGPDGSNGIEGENGIDGSKGAESPISIVEINEDDFNREYNKPGIFTVQPNAVKNSDVINISGRMFTNTDAVSVDGVDCKSRVFGSSAINCIVDNISAGKGKTVQVIQRDGTRSNRASIDILPTISYIEFNGNRSNTSPPSHFNEDTLVTVVGSGFTAGMVARINDLLITTQVQVVDKNTLKLPLRKPPNIQSNPAGEKAILQLYTLDGLASNEIEIVFATYQFLVFGDSMAWGQGLQDQYKTSTIVMNHVTQLRKGARVYREVFAHSGAIIGYNDNTPYTKKDGEVPDSYPTVFQQQASYTGDKSKIDLILIDGGINDIGLTKIFAIDPSDTDRDIKLYELVELYCYHHMKQLLKEVSANYTNAKIIVTGYPQIVSNESQIEYLAAFLFAIGIPAIPGSLITLAVKDILVKRSKILAERSDAEFKKVVNEVNSGLANGPRIFYTQPLFKPSNSIFANESFLWGLSLDTTWEGADKPELGGVSKTRAYQCYINNGPPYCSVASIGHPNVEGASEYAKCIINLLERIGI